MKKLTLLCASTAFIMPTMAFAQSSGTAELEGETEIVITGTRTSEVGGVQAPDTPKAKAVLTSEFIQHQTPGQSINDTINSLPGVSFQNNDPYGSAGGTMTIRGFDNSRISQTFDGIPLNDFGQLCSVLEPAGRSRIDRAGQRQPGLDRRRQPDRRGLRLDRQLPHPQPVPRIQGPHPGLGRRI